MSKVEITQIVKGYTQKVSAHYQSYDFATGLTATVEVELGDKKSLVDANNKLFAAARALTVHDMQKAAAKDPEFALVFDTFKAEMERKQRINKRRRRTDPEEGETT